MTTNLQLLGIAIGIGLVHLLATVLVVIAQHGIGYVLSPRDEDRPLTGVGARFNRAFRNYLETFPLFLGAVLLSHATGHHDGLTVVGAKIYVLARIAYVPLYLMGLTFVRTLVWMAAFVGIAMVLASSISM